MFATNFGREPLPNAVFKAIQRSIDIASTESKRVWITGTTTPPLKIVPQTSAGFSRAAPSWKCISLPNQVKNNVNATIAQTTITQNAPLTPVKPSDFFFGAAFCCVVAII